MPDRRPEAPPAVTVEHDRVAIGRLSVGFERTLRIPEDGKRYPLPPSLGRFPLRRVADYASRVPASWRAHGGVFMPMWQREALWLSFAAPHWQPVALKVGVGLVNAVTGEPWRDAIGAGAQDYVVCPPQPWLDGIRGEDGTVRQFVAMPLGMGYTVEGQLSGEERHGGIQLCVYAARPGRFPDEPPPRPVPSARPRSLASAHSEVYAAAPPPQAELGIAAGGSIEQQVYPDPHGLATWQPEPVARLFVHLVDAGAYQRITGEAAPPSPIDAATYAAHGLPWFDLDDAALGDTPASDALTGVKGVAEKDAEHGFTGLADDSTVAIPDPSVHVLPVPPQTTWPKG